MSEFEFPTNIKQIGSIGDGARIYVEDYVHTYLQQYAEAAGYDESIALLIGRNMIIDGKKVLFVSGAIQGIYTQTEKGIMTFSQESLNYAYEQMQAYFRGLEIVGWMQSQPGFGTMLNVGYADYHLRTFQKPEQVMFIMDPLEGLNAFYVWNKEKKELVETRGYFIYYEKNRGMHEYMLKNKIQKEKEQHKTVRELLGSYNSTKEPENREEQEEMFEEDYYEQENIKVVSPKIQLLRSKQKNIEEPRRLVNMLVSLSGVLLVATFIMGAGLMQSTGRLSSLEAKIDSLSNSYKDITAQISDGKALSVFAQQKAQVNSDLDKENQSSLNVAKKNNQQPSPQPKPQQTPENVSTPPVEPKPQATPTVVVTPEPRPSSTPVAAVDFDTYIVESGDSLIYISQKFYGSSKMVKSIMELNGMKSPTELFYGKVIKLPKK